MTRTNIYGELRRGNRKIMSTRGLNKALKKAEHKHSFVYVNAYRKYDLYKCKCGKEKKVFVGDPCPCCGEKINREKI